MFAQSHAVAPSSTEEEVSLVLHNAEENKICNHARGALITSYYTIYHSDFINLGLTLG